ncbi:cobalt-precorrin-6A reductase [Microvirga antarctica]|uniref:cobalt-precorrin-6A reductase n=1 Tax=Microvirga antarctica TaxID=2819233 RepID=UPI001B315A52|nr:cobalt-precorrin-6A reductase [Microvirga antarctica]
MRILILGGTADAASLSQSLAERPATGVILSLAGRTRAPSPVPVPTRSGGFGGAEGLRDWLLHTRIDAVIDATHPFAAMISQNAAMACAACDLPLLAFRRAPWTRVAGDRWIDVASMVEAAAALGSQPRRVFLTIGRQELAAFATAPQHVYLVRTIEPIGDALPVPQVTALQARGPFDEAADSALLRDHGIDMLVSKNSGGIATYGKIAAARALSLPVVMVSRPDKPDGPFTESLDDALAWVEAHRPAP